jgi:putative phage-type endonuclease
MSALERFDCDWSTPGARMVLPADVTRARWLKARQRGVGGSDVAAIVGLSRWNTGYSVWLDKTGKPLPDIDRSAMEWGRRLEPVLASHFADTHPGIQLCKVGLLQSIDHPIALASVDALTDCGRHCPQPDGIWEGKTTNWRMAEEWDDDQVPDAAELQTQWYLGVTGRSHAHVSVLVDGHNPMQRTIQADPDLFAVLVAEAERWWATYVETDKAPPITSHLALDEVKERWPDAGAEPKIVDPADVEDILGELAIAKAAEKAAKADRALLEAQLRHIIGDSAELWAAGDLVATCKTTRRKSYTVAETTYRRLLIKEH